MHDPLMVRHKILPMQIFKKVRSRRSNFCRWSEVEFTFIEITMVILVRGHPLLASTEENKAFVFFLRKK